MQVIEEACGQIDQVLREVYTWLYWHERKRVPAGELDYAKTQTAKIEFALDWAIAHLGTTIRKLQEAPRSDADSACVDALWQGYKCLQKGPRKWLERAELGYWENQDYHQSGRGHLLKKLAKSLHKARALLIQGEVVVGLADAACMDAPPVTNYYGHEVGG